MKLARRIGAFIRAPSVRKGLALEAAWELLRARILTLRPATVYSPALGTLVESEPPGGPVSGRAEAEEIGHVVEVVGRCLPFRALCLQQAIAVRRMLTRRGIPAMVYLGVARDRADRAQADLDQAAHAWVAVGSRVVSGDGVLEKYAIVARFA
ncbi:MAG: lasso peptide biosynthesis B2 protein [Paracoccaceae bacterium]